jgi:transposase
MHKVPDDYMTSAKLPAGARHGQDRQKPVHRPQMSADQVSNAITDFIASGRRVTRCPAAYVAPSPQYHW